MKSVLTRETDRFPQDISQQKKKYCITQLIHNQNPSQLFSINYLCEKVNLQFIYVKLISKGR